VNSYAVFSNNINLTPWQQLCLTRGETIRETETRRGNGTICVKINIHLGARWYRQTCRNLRASIARCIVTSSCTRNLRLHKYRAK